VFSPADTEEGGGSAEAWSIVAWAEAMAADGMSYCNGAEVIAHAAAQSQSDDTKATISKSALLSGARDCWSEGLTSDGLC